MSKDVSYFLFLRRATVNEADGFFLLGIATLPGEGSGM